MSDWVIRADDLGKRYLLGNGTSGYKTLRESIAGMSLRPLRRISGTKAGKDKPNQSQDYLWALRDATFEICRGEVVAIIGGNGAGKSTLLKILSRISEPTKGFADIKGRVGSLLEVGTGFHPELSGRENIFLNGVILGMGKKEIERKLDEIVAFAEVERFLETPVKRYSTGMYLRLAFGVAAHLQPDILLVDEVLAVGDTAFQNKCLGRMENVAREGRTVLFVSHNMGAVRSLCTKGILLRHGQIEYAGDVGTCIREYFASIGILRNEAPHEQSRGPGFGRVWLTGVRGNTIDQSQPFTVETTLTLECPVNGIQFFLLLKDMHGRQICHLRRESSELSFGSIAAGQHSIRVSIPPLWLSPGLYSLQFKAALTCDSGQQRFLSDCFPLDVDGISSHADSVLHPMVDWSVHHDDGLCLQSHETDEPGRVVA